MDTQDLQKLKNKYDIIGNDPALNRALEMAVAVAPTDLTVLVTGESGVGKDNIPKIIHQFSRRKNAKYFAVNCGAIPEGTIDSELFGHEKGSFTGAIEARKGYFEEADGGTLFLDEVGELPLSSQAKLLRVLQSGEFLTLLDETGRAAESVRLAPEETRVISAVDRATGERSQIYAEPDTRGRQTFRKYCLQGDCDLSLGRTPDNQIVFENKYVSAHHARLICKGGAWSVVDTQSSNGTFVNGQRTALAQLKPGDVVTIPANVKHWHGDKAGSWFSHLAVEAPGQNCSNEWCEAVDPEAYAALRED